MHLGRVKHREAVLVVDGECRHVLVPLGAALGAVMTHAGRVVGQAHLDGTYPNRAGIPLAPVDSHTDAREHRRSQRPDTVEALGWGDLSTAKTWRQLSARLTTDAQVTQAIFSKMKPSE
jgi:hypothetical protein